MQLFLYTQNKMEATFSYCEFAHLKTLLCLPELAALATSCTLAQGNSCVFVIVAVEKLRTGLVVYDRFQRKTSNIWCVMFTTYLNIFEGQNLSRFVKNLFFYSVKSLQTIIH